VVKMAQMVKETPARAVLKLAEGHLRRPAPQLPVAEPCCCSDGSAAATPDAATPAKPPRCC